MKASAWILGGGMTGLAAGLASGFPVYEADPRPGGICRSYYVRPGDRERLSEAPADGRAYRFEIGGGHWIFGADTVAGRLLESFASLKRYTRRSSVYLNGARHRVPFPLQNHLRFLDPEMREHSLLEMRGPRSAWRTMKEWLGDAFGKTLCDLFFFPFHDRYTAGLYSEIAPQDAYKSPLSLHAVMRGARADVSPAGYNATFLYPVGGLDVLARRMSEHVDVRYGRRAVRIDPANREVTFADGSKERYALLLATIPLNQLVEMAGVRVAARTDPHTSVLVLNIGALRGPHCPDDHWLYVPDSHSGFYRVGVYDNVDESFLPAPTGRERARVSLYVERAYRGGTRPSGDEIARYAAEAVRELRGWKFIDEVEVVDPTWIDVAYTWSWPGSGWVDEAITALESVGIHPIGRYARWKFQGIAESIREGLSAGAALRIGARVGEGVVG